MTNKVNPIQNRKADAFKTAGAIAYGGHGGSGVIMDGSNPSEISKQDGDIDESAFDPTNGTGGFDYLNSSGLDVTISAGEAFVFGAWLAIDTTTTVTLDSSPQTVYVGWDKDRDTNNDVIIGVDSDFDNNTTNTDQRVAIWEFTNDGSSVTGSTDKRGSLGFENTTTVFGRDGDVTAQSGDYGHSQLSGVSSQDHHAPGDGLTDNSGTFDVTVSDFAGTLLSDDGSNNLQVDEGSISHDNINQTSVSSQDHHAPGEGLTDNSGTFDVTVSDFAGTLLSDDGSNNLQVDEGSISHDNINQTSVSSQDHHAPGDGLTDNSGTFDVTVSDFAGTLLSDDGSNNLQVNESSITHDNLSGGKTSDAHHTKYTDSDAREALYGTGNASDIVNLDFDSNKTNNIVKVAQDGSTLTYTDITNAGSDYTDEDAQDAVGTIMSGSGSTTVTYDDANNTISVSSTKYTDSEARSAVRGKWGRDPPGVHLDELEPDPDNLARHIVLDNGTDGMSMTAFSHNNIDDKSPDDHHSKTSSASELSDVSADSVSDAHHPEYTDSNAVSAVDAEVTSNTSVSQMDTQVSTNDTDIDNRSRIWVQESQPSVTPNPAPDRDGGAMWYEVGDVATDRWISTDGTSSGGRGQTLYIENRDDVIISDGVSTVVSIDATTGYRNWVVTDIDLGSSHAMEYSATTNDIVIASDIVGTSVWSYDANTGQQNWSAENDNDTLYQYAIETSPNGSPPPEAWFYVAASGGTSERGITRYQSGDGSKLRILDEPGPWQIQRSASNGYLIYTRGDNIGCTLDGSGTGSNPWSTFTFANTEHNCGITLGENDDNRGFFVTVGGEVAEFDLSNGSSVWTADPTDITGYSANAPNCVHDDSNNTLVVPDNDRLVGLDAQSGSNNWTYTDYYNYEIRGGLAFYTNNAGQETVVYGNEGTNNNDDSVFGVTSRSGAISFAGDWAYNPGTKVASDISFISSTNSVAFIDDDGDMYSVYGQPEIDTSYTSNGSRWLEVP